MTLLANRNAVVSALLGSAMFLVLTCNAAAQPRIEPTREQLLNGLQVLIWEKPADQEVLLKLRVHSGAAFDLAGRSGQMVTLGEILFPDPNTRDYFTEMQGRLNVITDYDSITITMQGHAREFEKMVEILRNGLVATPLSADVVAKIREGRIKIVRETSISPSLIADRAIAHRLFGDFPYGQPYTGSVESLGRIERADLMLARDRFLNPNNATLVVAGGVQQNRVMKALRQLLGSWRKSEEIVPSSFRQPVPPETRTLIINAPADQSVEIRIAARGLARSDQNSAAATVLAGIVRQRWEKLVPELTRVPMFVRNEPHYLPGMFVMGASVNNKQAAKSLSAAKQVLQTLMTTPATAAELDQAKNEALAAAAKAVADTDGIANAWLDATTFKLSSINEQMDALRNVSASDVRNVAAQLFGKGALATIAVGNSEELKAELERDAPVELLGEVKPTPVPAAPNQQAKPTTPNKPD